RHYLARARAQPADCPGDDFGTGSRCAIAGSFRCFRGGPSSVDVCRTVQRPVTLPGYFRGPAVAVVEQFSMALFDPTAPRMIRARRAYGGLERAFDPFMKAACARCTHRKIKQDPEASNVSVCQRLAPARNFPRSPTAR